MALVFLGDVASPDAERSAELGDSLRKVAHVFEDNDTVLNLEGMISEQGTETDTPVLFNDPSILPVLEEFNTRAVSLANNHTLDLPELCKHTVDSLARSGVASCGAGSDVAEAEACAEFTSEGRQVLVLAFCWDILMQHQVNEAGMCYVNPLKPKRALELVKEARARAPGAVIVLKMHWSFDLEKLPFPLYRQLSRDLIDVGANAIIGCHSHCVQGGERYKNGIIVYGLGNFFIPWHTFINGTIHFPEFARNEMALEWDPESGAASCHWFRYENDEKGHRLDYKGAEDFDTSQTLKGYSQYCSMGMTEYVSWFRKNRRKSKLMPIYVDHRHSFRNACIDSYLRSRIRFARFLARTGIREWNN